MRLTFLGTGSSRPTIERNVACISLEYGQEVLLFDCGEGSQRQMQRNVKQSRITKIFITHFHGDHYLGIPGLLMTLALNKREDPIDIYGPSGTSVFMGHLFSSGYMGLTYDVRIHEVNDELLQFETYSIRVFPVQHGIPSVGYCFMESDKRGSFDTDKARLLGITGPMFKELEKKELLQVNGKIVHLHDVTGPVQRGVKIVYTGDTRPMSFPDFLLDPTVLIHEATFLKSDERGDTFHSTVADACDAAHQLNAKTLILTHLNNRYEDDEIRQLAHTYVPDAIVAYDLMKVEL